MAIYHCSCKIISRSKGRSAVGASAYRSGEKLENERDGVVHDYTKKQGVVYSEIILPKNAPKEWKDRSTLWNEVEKVEKGKNAQLSREYEVALPRELTREQQIECAKNIANNCFVNEGMCADIAIHDKGDGNPHVHIMTTMRPIDENGKWENKSEKLYLCKNESGEEKAFSSKELAKEENEKWKKQYYYSKGGSAKEKKVYLSEYEKENNTKYAEYEKIKDRKFKDAKDIKQKNEKIEKWDSKEFLQNVRAGVSKEINMSLEKYGHQEKVDHRSYKEQGVEQVPTIHIGVVASQMEKRGIKTERGNINREIKDKNEQIKTINAQTRELTIKRINVQTDIQLQNVHNEMQLYKAQIPQSNEKQLEEMKNSINVLDKKMEKIKESGAYKGQEIVLNFEQRNYIPRIEYEYNKYKKTRSEVETMISTREQELLKQINKNLKEFKDKEQQNERLKKEINREKTPQESVSEYVKEKSKEISEIRKEYEDIQKRLLESEKIENRPRITNEYAVAYNNAKRCIQEVERNQDIFIRAKEEKANLSLLKRSERKMCDSTMKKAQENIKKQMETLNKLGIKDISNAPAKMKEFRLNDEKEKQILATFNQTRVDLQNRGKELEMRFEEIKASLPATMQESIGKLKTECKTKEIKAENKQKEEKTTFNGMSLKEWEADLFDNFKNSVQNELDEKSKEREKNQSNERER